VYGAHFYDGFYVQPLWRLLGEDVTCTIMTGFLDARIAVILDEALPNAAPVWLSEVRPAPAGALCGPCDLPMGRLPGRRGGRLAPPERCWLPVSVLQGTLGVAPCFCCRLPAGRAVLLPVRM
jgi:hypothetical protein